MKSIVEIKKIRNLKIVAESDDGFLGYWTDPTTQKVYSIIMSWDGGWEHLSIAPIRIGKTPSWELMCKFKEMFFKDEEACVQYHPKKSEYINIHPNCLHIWRPLYEKLPTPPNIYV